MLETWLHFKKRKVKVSSIKEAHRNSIWGIDKHAEWSCPGFPGAPRKLHARNLLWTIDGGGSVKAMGLGNDDRPADAPRLSGVHDWKVGKLKPQKR